MCAGGPYHKRGFDYPSPIPERIVIADHQLHYHEYRHLSANIYRHHHSYRIRDSGGTREAIA